MKKDRALILGILPTENQNFKLEDITKPLKKFKPDILVLELDPSLSDYMDQLDPSEEGMPLSVKVYHKLKRHNKDLRCELVDLEGRSQFYQSIDLYTHQDRFLNTLQSLDDSKELKCENITTYHMMKDLFNLEAEISENSSFEESNSDTMNSVIDHIGSYQPKLMSDLCSREPKLKEYGPVLNKFFEYESERIGKIADRIKSIVENNPKSRVAVLIGLFQKSLLSRKMV